MIHLLLTSVEMNEISRLLDVEPRYVGLYYHKQRPLEMFILSDLVVAVLNYEEEDESTVNVINYAELSIPLWKQNLPDLVKYVSTRKNIKATNLGRAELLNNVA